MKERAQRRDTVLVVEDDDDLRGYYERLLSQLGIVVESAADGAQALALVTTHEFQAIVSDINLPVYSGLEFLRAVRERDLDIPVILVTGQPDVQTAIEAVEYGAFRYLVKPVDRSVLIDTVRRACEMHRMAKLRREAWKLLGRQGPELGDRASLEARYQVALSTLFLEFQPVVRPGDSSVFGYEAFARSSEPTLQRPEDLFDAAYRLGRVQALGRAIRKCLLDASASAPEHAVLFLNVHPDELSDSELSSENGLLAPIASRVVLDISERANLDGISGLKARLTVLRERGFRVALDDLGAGRAPLGGFGRVEPEFLKLDRSLVGGIEDSAGQLSVVNGIAEVCGASLDISVIAEGVETAAEFATLSQVGVKLFQGHHFAHPQRGFANPWNLAQ